MSEEMVEQWLAEVPVWDEVVVAEALRREGGKGSHGMIARRLGLGRHGYVAVMWAAKKLERRGLAREFNPQGSTGGGSQRMAELLAAGEIMPGAGGEL